MPWLAPKTGRVTSKELFIKNLKIPRGIPMLGTKSSGLLRVFLNISSEKEEILKRAMEVAQVKSFQFGKKGIAYIDRVY